MKRMGKKKYVPLKARIDDEDDNRLYIECGDPNILNNLSISSFKVIGFFDDGTVGKDNDKKIDLIFQISDDGTRYVIFGKALDKDGLTISTGEIGYYSAVLNNYSDENSFDIGIENPNYKNTLNVASFKGYAIFDEVEPGAAIPITFEV